MYQHVWENPPDEIEHRSIYCRLIVDEYRDQTCFSMHLHLLDPEGDVETRAWKARVWTTRGVHQMLMYQKTMFDRYYCIKSFCLLKTLEKRLRKVHFCITLMAHLKACFQNSCSRANRPTYVILIIIMLLNYVRFFARYCWWRQFCDDLERARICKLQKPCISRTWIAWLIKTWLLIACDTAFYAINRLCVSIRWRRPLCLSQTW